MASVADGGNGGGGGGQVVMELSHIKDLVRQLEGHLGGGSLLQQQEVCRSLTSQISSVTERSITLITSYYSSLDAGRKRSAAASPLSDVADAPFNNAKKRKTRGKVNDQVRVRAAAGGDIPADDGHSWRKYGQKEILGAKYPRSYYRCTHRHSQGCSATKQVQRADEDPTLFDVIYLGAHTCVQSGTAAAAVAAGEAGTVMQQQPPEHDTNTHSLLLQSMSSSLTVKAEGPAAAPEPPQGWVAAAVTPFCLSSTPGSGCPQAAPAELSPFSAPSTASDNWGVSPATSDSNQHAAAVSLPPFEVVAAAGDVQFELGEVVSALVDFSDDDFDISSFFA